MDCRLCDLLLQDDNDTLIAKMNYGHLYLNFNQCFKGRVMYVLKRHYRDITDIDLEEYASVDREVIVVAKAIKEIFSPALVNVAALGNHVQHLHFHIIPRYEDDPQWGHPPWPHGENLLSPGELREMSRFIRARLSVNRDFKRWSVWT